jgi:hypothetical protein
VFTRFVPCGAVASIVSKMAGKLAKSLADPKSVEAKIAVVRHCSRSSRFSAIFPYLAA